MFTYSDHELKCKFCTVGFPRRSGRQCGDSQLRQIQTSRISCFVKGTVNKHTNQSADGLAGRLQQLTPHAFIPLIIHLSHVLIFSPRFPARLRQLYFKSSSSSHMFPHLQSLTFSLSHCHSPHWTGELCDIIPPYLKRHV